MAVGIGGSVLHFFSIGVAVENKPLDSRFLNVLAVESSPAVDGEVTFNPQSFTHKGKDIQGKEYQVNATLDNSINCEWLPAGSNRVTPPDIQRNEHVEVWRLGDTDRFFWKAIGLDDNLRTLETVIFAISASPSPTGKLDINSCYFAEWSAHKKAITISTSQANGEPYRYLVQINAGEGEINVADDIGTGISLNSENGRIHHYNADGTEIKMERKRVDINADESIRFKSGGTVMELKPSGTTLKTPQFDITKG